MTTPILTCSSPEGARLSAPSRIYPGNYCRRRRSSSNNFDGFGLRPLSDRALFPRRGRAQTVPGEFYQLIWKWRCDAGDVFAVLEEVLPPIFSKFGKYPAAKGPFRRISYREALEKYGSDKPDLRIKAVLEDLTDFNDVGFAPFEGKTIKAIVFPVFDKTRKFIDTLAADFEKHGKQNVLVQTGQRRTDGRRREISGAPQGRIHRKLHLANGSAVFMVAENGNAVYKPAGVMRNMLGNAIESLSEKNKYEFCWIVDFPMYEIGEESGQLEFCHNPFSMPQGGMEALEKQNPLEILAYQYDLVCNGIELSSGAVRNHSPEIMLKAFDMVGLTKEDVIAKFPALYHAFSFGAPPHAGIAPGVDRMVMILLDEPNIREIIPFPMNKNAKDLMMNAPAEVSEKQLDDVHIRIKQEKQA
ncbi:MAG: amino acid--tRNA ligase-related protein [Candidatus Borkfalkia sp.]